MPKKFPLVTALVLNLRLSFVFILFKFFKEWSPIHNLKALRRKMAHQEEKEQEDTQVLSPTASEQSKKLH
jgi:hypothetical protein